MNTVTIYRCPITGVRVVIVTDAHGFETVTVGG